MHGPTCIFWANLTPFSLEARLRDGGAATVARADETKLEGMRADVAGMSSSAVREDLRALGWGAAGSREVVQERLLEARQRRHRAEPQLIAHYTARSTPLAPHCAALSRTTTTPSGQPLTQFMTPHHGFNCDACGTVLQKGATAYGNRAEDYDVCGACFGAADAMHSAEQ